MKAQVRLGDTPAKFACQALLALRPVYRAYSIRELANFEHLGIPQMYDGGSLSEFMKFGSHLVRERYEIQKNLKIQEISLPTRFRQN